MSEDRTRPIRDLLAALGGEWVPRPRKCGGALVPVTRETYRDMERLLDVSFSRGIRFPENGGATGARVVCGADVEETVGVAGERVQCATCAKCAAVERRVRGLFAEMQARSGAER